MTDPKPDQEFRHESAALEDAYLQGGDEIERSGFGGGAARWEAERRPLTDGIAVAGTFLDVGCANGYLAACVVRWAADRGIELVPFGIDLGEKLIAEARTIHPGHFENFVAADAWEWEPGRRFTYVYSLLDLSPDALFTEWINRLASWVEPGGRLIVGAYGSRSRSIAPQHVAKALADVGYQPLGTASGGPEPITRFAWAEIAGC